jgi:hypothetical protein
MAVYEPHWADDLGLATAAARGRSVPPPKIVAARRRRKHAFARAED